MRKEGRGEGNKVEWRRSLKWRYAFGFIVFCLISVDGSGMDGARKVTRGLTTSKGQRAAYKVYEFLR